MFAGMRTFELLTDLGIITAFAALSGRTSTKMRNKYFSLMLTVFF